MADLHLYTPTYYNTKNEEITFNLYLSAQNKVVEKDEYFYYNPLVGLSGTQTFNSKFFPVDGSSLSLKVGYLSAGTTINLTMTSIGSTTYNNKSVLALNDPTTTITPSPCAYLNETTGGITFPIISDDYNSGYGEGAISIYIEQGYIIPSFFTNDFYANDIIVDYGDENIETYSYNEGQADTITHTYTAANLYTISVTANTLDETITQEFADAIKIVDNFENTDESLVFRANANSVVELPYQRPYIPINEWEHADAINSVFEQHYLNFDYIMDATAIYQLAPLYERGWGYVTDTEPSTKLTWHSSTFATSAIPASYNTDKIVSLYSLTNNTYNNLYIGRTNKIEKFSYSLNSQFATDDTLPNGNFETATEVKAFAVSSDNKIYILDSRKLLIRVYNYDTTTADYVPIFEWGGLGGITGKTKFYKPNDLFIANGKVYVVDSGNNCVKRFTLGGQWEQTYTSEDFTSGNISTDAPISATTDLDKNLYIVNKTNIVKFDYDGNFVWSKPIQLKSADIVSVRGRNNFIYILTQDNIIRVFTNGESTNVFATRSKLNNYSSLYIDNTGNIYITDGQLIVKYIDSPILFDATPNQPDEYWTWDEMKIRDNEFVSALTYNKFFHRMYDNLKTFYHTIENKIIKNSDGSLSMLPLQNCDVGPLGPLPVSKDDIYIGLNEFVTPEVINRCLGKLLEVQRYLLDVILNKYSGCSTGEVESFKFDTPLAPDCCWDWAARRTALCCLTWERLRQLQTTWYQATADCCDPSILILPEPEPEEPATPTYSISANKTSMIEGENIKFNINTTNVDNGTILYWSFYGDIDASDFVGGQITNQSIEIQNNTANFYRIAATNSDPEGPEVFYADLSASLGMSPVASSQNITIDDTMIMTVSSDVYVVIQAESSQVRNWWANEQPLNRIKSWHNNLPSSIPGYTGKLYVCPVGSDNVTEGINNRMKYGDGSLYKGLSSAEWEVEPDRIGQAHIAWPDLISQRALTTTRDVHREIRFGNPEPWVSETTWIDTITASNCGPNLIDVPGLGNGDDWDNWKTVTNPNTSDFILIALTTHAETQQYDAEAFPKGLHSAGYGDTGGPGYPDAVPDGTYSDLAARWDSGTVSEPPDPEKPYQYQPTLDYIYQFKAFHRAYDRIMSAENGFFKGIQIIPVHIDAAGYIGPNAWFKENRAVIQGLASKYARTFTDVELWGTKVEPNLAGTYRKPNIEDPLNPPIYGIAADSNGNPYQAVYGIGYNAEDWTDLRVLTFFNPYTTHHDLTSFDPQGGTNYVSPALVNYGWSINPNTVYKTLTNINSKLSSRSSKPYEIFDSVTITDMLSTGRSIVI